MAKVKNRRKKFYGKSEFRQLPSIGLPVYNGEKYIRQALDSLLAQDFKDFELIISDNASTDNTAEICKEYAKKDDRIRYYRNEVNIGGDNFKKVLDLATAPYFMWAAADDVWQPDFLSSCVKMLDENKDIGMAFSNIVNIDSFGRVIRTYPSFEKFSGKNSFRTIFNYVKDPEILGKANPIYSVYRLELCKKAWGVSPLSEEGGSDMCFVLAAISRSGICIDNRVLFQKRLVRDSDQQEFISEIKITNPNRHIFRLNKSFEYIRGNLRAVKGTKYFFFVLIIMITRMHQVFFNSFLANIYRVKSCVKNRINKRR
jgi:glycosyltransferase involved in cell wall biosynthesis